MVAVVELKYDAEDNEFKLLNRVAVVAFKLLIDNVELVDKLFKFVNNDVDVKFKYPIDVV
jgi:hypothetical protein